LIWQMTRSKEIRPKVSVIVVCYNERDNIDRCMRSLLLQDYPEDCYEIIFVDNGSTDGTQELLSQFVSEHVHVRLEINPIRGIAGSRNMGLRSARYDLIAFIDADCYAPASWLGILVSFFCKIRETDESVAGVGGANYPPAGHSRFYDILALFLDSYLGSHNSVQGRQFREDRAVPHLPTVNVLYDKEKILHIAGFDVSFTNIGEDQDLSYRITANGWTLYYVADAGVVHMLRSNFWAWSHNMFVYGKGRMWLFRKHPQRRNLVLLSPFCLVFCLVLSMLWWRSVCPLFFLIYFAFLFASSVAVCIRARRLDYVIELSLLYALTHLSYGAGEWFGLIKNRDISRE
jgi:glycosyltransferase involved in cell wall biosynthesis